MLQRIQTVYLLLIVGFAMAMMFMGLASVQVGNEFYVFDVAGVMTAGGEQEMIYSTWGLFALTAVIAFVAMVTIFLYKKRILQIRLSVFNGILMVAFYALFGFFYWNFKSVLPDDEVFISLKIALAFPFICLILDYLAIRNIGADEALVRSLERLR